MAQHVLQAHLPTVWQNQAILPTNKPRASSQDLLLKIIEVSSSCVPTHLSKKILSYYGNVFRTHKAQNATSECDGLPWCIEGTRESWVKLIV